VDRWTAREKPRRPSGVCDWLDSGFGAVKSFAMPALPPKGPAISIVEAPSPCPGLARPVGMRMSRSRDGDHQPLSARWRPLLGRGFAERLTTVFDSLAARKPIL